MLREPGVERGARIRFSFDGLSLEGFAGESVAAALAAAGVLALRASPRNDEPRGAFCWMGLCQECTVVIEGARRPACRTALRDGLRVRSGTVG